MTRDTMSVLTGIKNMLQPSLLKRRAFFLLADTLLLTFSFHLAILLHLDFHFGAAVYPAEVILLFPAVQISALALFRVYGMTWRYVGLIDLFNIFSAFVLSTFMLLVFSIIPVDSFFSGFSKRIIVADGLISLLLIAALRIARRFSLEVFKSDRDAPGGKRVLIIGAGNAGEMVVRDMSRLRQRLFHPVAFLDDDPRKIGNYIHGVRIEAGTGALADVAQKKMIEALIIAIPSLDHKTLRRLYESARTAGIGEIKVIPRIYNFQRPEISLRALEDISMEDLIGRQSISVDSRNMESFLRGKVILISGAAGSIGSEIVIQACSFQPGAVVLFDIDETDLHNLGIRIRRRFPRLQSRIHYVAGDIRDEQRVDEIIRHYRPQVVFHAAAYKHVPMMEWNVSEAVKVNMFGTWNLAGSCVENKVEKFVMISTDKAVRPTSVMGATKRLAEGICQAVGDSAQNLFTEFVSVRFGNVLGSRGSVLPMFLDQLKHGEALEVTHEEMRRYFMTIPEAVSLVLEAAIIGRGGQVMVLDMGDPVYIRQFAEELIRLHGLRPYVDIDIHFTGMRPGEKLFEEILTAEEGTDASRHEKIFIARNASRYDLSEIEEILRAFRCALSGKLAGRENEIRSLLKRHVAHYDGAAPGAPVPMAPQSMHEFRQTAVGNR